MFNKDLIVENMTHEEFIQTELDSMPNWSAEAKELFDTYEDWKDDYLANR